MQYVYIIAIINNADITPLRFASSRMEAFQIHAELADTSLIRMTKGVIGYEVYIQYSNKWISYIDFNMNRW